MASEVDDPVCRLSLSNVTLKIYIDFPKARFDPNRLGTARRRVGLF